MSRSTLAIGFGWFCGSMTVLITDSLVWSFSLALVAGISFGVAESIWDNSNTDTSRD